MSENNSDRKGTFLFYEDWWNVISKLESSVKAKCFDALCMYAFQGKEPEDPTIRAITGLMLRAIDRDTKKYNSIREQRRKAVQKRWQKAKDTNVSSRNTKNTNVSFVSSRNAKNTLNVSSKEDLLFTPKVVNKESESYFESKSFEEFWNTVVKDTPVRGIQKLTPKRKAKIKSLVKEYGKQTVVDVIRKIPQTPFLLGGGSQGWVISFDWLIKGDNFLKVKEGNYDDGNKKANNDGTGKQMQYGEDEATKLIKELLNTPIVE